VEVLGSELNTSETHVARDLAVSRRLGEVIAFIALVLLHQGLDSGLSRLRKLGFSLGARHRARFTEVADVTLVIVLGASTGVTVNDSVEVLSVEALHIRLSSHVGHLLSEVAHVTVVSAIVRSPGLEVRLLGTRSVGTLALRLMELSKIDINESCLFFLLTFFFISRSSNVSSIDKELLRSASGLGDDVFNINWLVRDLDFLPILSIVPGELNLSGRLTDLAGNNEGTMISDIVDVVASVSRGESNSTIPGHV